jgi:hypothetical protein
VAYPPPPPIQPPDIRLQLLVALAVVSLLIVGGIVLAARRPRTGIAVLSVIALVLYAGELVIASLPVDHHSAQGYQAFLLRGELVVVPLTFAPMVVDTAWILGLLAAARIREWAWFSLTLGGAFITLLSTVAVTFPVLLAPFDTTSQFAQDRRILLGFTALPFPLNLALLLTPLVTLAFSLIGPVTQKSE